MRICVSEELEDIRIQLIQRGYISICKNITSPCDAIICNLKEGDLIKLNIQNNIQREGTLIIDSGSKTIEEIEYILNNKIYNSML